MSVPDSAPLSDAARAVTLELEPGVFRFSLWRNVSVTLWTAQATYATGERVLRVSRQLNRQLPEGRSQVLIVKDGTLAPDQETSEMMAEIYDPRVSRIVCMVAVLEGSGFWASSIRGRMTHMRLAVGGVTALSAHENIEGVVSWLPAEHVKRTGVRLNPDELRSMLLGVRALGTQDVLDASARPAHCSGEGA